MHGSLLISVTPFSQACEHDVLLSVVKWGEAQVLQNMADQGTKSFNYIVTCCSFLIKSSLKWVMPPVANLGEGP